MAPVPAHLAKYAKSLGSASEFAVASRARFPTISIGDNRFTAIDEEGNETVLGLKHFDFIVVDANPNTSKIYFASGYDPTKSSAPDCYSDNGLFPDIRVARPQASDCTNCPMNMWGSAKSNLSGKDIKACSDYKKLAVIPFDANGNELGIHMFRLSPASGPNWGKHVAELARIRITDDLGVNPRFVMNRAFWSDKKNVMAFEMIDFLDEGELSYVEEVRDAGKFIDWIGTDDQSQRRPQLAAAPRNVAQTLTDQRGGGSSRKEEAIDAEFEDNPPQPSEMSKRAGRSHREFHQEVNEAKQDLREAGRTRRRVGGKSEFLDEHEDGVPGRARAEMQEGGRSQGQRLSAVEATKARAREQIANGTRSR